MERETAIRWINDGGYCKIAFVIEDTSYLLYRKQVWKDDEIYGIPKDKTSSIDVVLARQLWNNLTEFHNFYLIEETTHD